VGLAFQQGFSKLGISMGGYYVLFFFLLLLFFFAMMDARNKPLSGGV
jgi:hypothetical protein